MQTTTGLHGKTSRGRYITCNRTLRAYRVFSVKETCTNRYARLLGYNANPISDVENGQALRPFEYSSVITLLHLTIQVRGIWSEMAHGVPAQNARQWQWCDSRTRYPASPARTYDGPASMRIVLGNTLTIAGVISTCFNHYMADRPSLHLHQLLW